MNRIPKTEDNFTWEKIARMNGSIEKDVGEIRHYQEGGSKSCCQQFFRLYVTGLPFFSRSLYRAGNYRSAVWRLGREQCSGSGRNTSGKWPEYRRM